MGSIESVGKQKESMLLDVRMGRWQRIKSGSRLAPGR